MKITKLDVENFRHIDDQVIEFGECLTVITGQNSTGKSSLLGWIAQAFDYKSKTKTLTGNFFKSKYSEIFRFCEENNFSNNYCVKLHYVEDDDLGIESAKTMTTRYVPKSKKGPERYRVDFDGRGVALSFPVVYLGLKRLIPFATEKYTQLKDNELDNNDIKLFSKLSKEILILLDRSIRSERVKSPNKDVLAMKTKNYGHLGNSAGQDNISQIITSLLLYKRLKNDEGDNYNGGILLIDAIDATLYAGSQIKLIKTLIKMAKIDNLQVIFTTHSLEILEYLSKKISEEIKINFLESVNKGIKNQVNPPFRQLKNKISVQIGERDSVMKYEVLCEDKVTEYWCKNLINNSKFKDIVNIMEGPFPEGTLATMASSKHKIFKKMYFVLDGDCRKKYKTKKIPQRTIILPGDYRPESILYEFLFNLSDDDDFWDYENNFTKQTCFSDYQTDKFDKGVIKRWFKDPKFNDYFGRGYAKLLNRWKKSNQNLVSDFQKEFSKLIEENSRS